MQRGFAALGEFPQTYRKLQHLVTKDTFYKEQNTIFSIIQKLCEGPYSMHTLSNDVRTIFNIIHKLRYFGHGSVGTQLRWMDCISLNHNI